MNHPSADSAIPRPALPHRRMSLQKKLWLAGLGFPTLLLIAAAIYMAHRAPTIRLIEWLESPYVRQIQVPPELEKSLQQVKNGTVSAYLPWGSNTHKQKYNAQGGPLPPVYKYFGVIHSIEINVGKIMPETIELIGGVTSLYSLQLDLIGSSNQEDDLLPLANLKNLKWLTIMNTRFPMTDATLEWVSKLEKLEHLHLAPNARFTESGLAKLKRLPNLKSIFFFNETILEHPGLFYSQFPALECFYLNMEDDCRECIEAVVARKKIDILSLHSKSGFRDESLALLHSLDSIGHININGAASDEAIAALRAALPKAQIHHFDPAKQRPFFPPGSN